MKKKWIFIRTLTKTYKYLVSVKKSPNSDIEHPLYDQEYYSLTDDPELKPICSHFGCNKILSPRESLFGNLCINHQPCQIK